MVRVAESGIATAADVHAFAKPQFSRVSNWREQQEPDPAVALQALLG